LYEKNGRSILKKEWANIFQGMDRKDIKISKLEVQKEVAGARKANR
jgi:hypothetical protein